MIDNPQNENLSDVFLHQEMEASYGRFVLGIIHNLKNQLNAEKMALQHLSRTLRNIEHRQEESDESELEALRRLKEVATMVSTTMGVSTERMLGITNSMLARSSTQHTQDIITVELNNIIRTEIEFLQYYPSFKYDTQTTLDLSSDELHIVCFPGDLGQVIQNIVLNSIDAMKDVKEKSLHISTKRLNDRVELKMHDNGPGMSKEMLDQVFHPFSSSKSEESSEAASGYHGGSGLGIWVCRTILDTLGGHIDIVSNHEDGTTVSITLPLAKLQS